jgi:hypothetical protein
LTNPLCEFIIGGRKDKKDQNVEEKSTLRNVTERNVYRCKHFIANQPKTTSE